jgi:hypothetical protein
MTKRLPSEIAINMNLHKVMILQQTELQYVNQMNYFDAESPCHIYFIGKRPRVTIDKDYFELHQDYIGLNFKIQYEDKVEELPLKFTNEFGINNLRLQTKYPYNTFQILLNEETLIDAKVSPFLQTFYHNIHGIDFLDFEVLYIGQSYGVEGARTAPDRLVNHSTLQGIYAEAISNNPDSEIWLALASFTQVNLMMFDGRTKFSEEEKIIDKERFSKAFEKINYEGMNEQQKINFTEAALIRYFEPPYNKIYKDSFPNPAHTTYSECYDLDINSVCIEMNTHEMTNCQFYSQTIKKAPWHMKDFLLHSREERKSMFEFI